MSKLQRTERCMHCRRKTGILTPDNMEGLNQILEATKKFIENPPQSDRKDACFSLYTNMVIVDDNAGALYCLCADCCKAILSHFLTGLVMERKEILFQKFDKIKEKLQDG